MKTLALLLLGLWLPLLHQAQSLPKSGDYVMLGTLNEDYAHYIYRSGAKVFYGYSIQEKSCENNYKSSSAKVKELFQLLEEQKFMEMTGLDPKTLQLDEFKENPYRVCIVSWKGVVHEVVWDAKAMDPVSVTMGRISEEISSFW